MTALAESAPDTAAELVFAVVSTADRVVGPAPRARAVIDTPPRSAPPAPARQLTAPQAAGPVPMVSGPARGAPGPILTPLPRVRLVPAPPPGRPRSATTAPGGPPPTLAERIQVLRADDRSLTCDETDEERPGAPATGDPALVARRLATASVEVIAGSRPAAQMARWLAPGVLDALRSRAMLARHAALHLTHAPNVRNLRICLLDERVVEATAVVDDGRRVRAVAVRLEAHRGMWRATALEVG